MVACNQSTEKSSNKIKNEAKKTDTAQEDKNSIDAKFDENGIQFNLPNKWSVSQGRNIDIYTTVPEENIIGQIVISHILDETIDKANKIQQEANKIPETDKAAIQKAAEEVRQLLEEFKELCRIVTIDKSKAEGNAQNELFSKYDNKDLIGKEDNFEFYLLYNNKPDINDLSEKSKKSYEEFFGEIKNFKSFIHAYKPVSETEKVSKNKFKFKTKTLDGKEIDSSILKSSKLTMINVWATFCQPCIEEMPDLQRLYEEVSSVGVNIIGVVSDTPDEETETLAKKILSTKGVKYTNIIPDETIVNNVLQNISALPTTLFVDSEGNIIGDLIVGARSKEEYKKEILNRLKNMN
ncbi:TlpA family protein disulfide reductase [Geosporobacter ferrireducens]|uniref:TlpA family protein disulfide reductase n=1 Tax=Geosporobacter ferrireducens TaxID=1424294 RepID=UPI00235342F0|nr:TlpA disulfide reductase family protein [Geosporobacter ferrireducens]